MGRLLERSRVVQTPATTPADGGRPVRRRLAPPAEQVGVDARLTLIVLLLLGLAVLLARLPLPPQGRAVAAVCIALLLPTAAGGTLRWGRSWRPGGELVLRFGIGSLLLVAAATGLDLVGVFRTTTVTWIGVGVAAGGGLRSLRPAALRTLRQGWSVPRPGMVLGFVAGFGGGTGAALYWRDYSPIPFQSTWDGLLHTGIIDRMIVEHRFSLSLSTISPSFNFDPYLPEYHIDLAAAQGLGGVPVLNMLWAGPFVICAIYGVGIFLLTRAVSGSSAAGIGAAGICGVLHAMRKSPNLVINLLPASEVVALAPLALLVLAQPERRTRLWRGCAVSAVLVPLHGLMGLLLLMVVLAAEGVLWLLERRSLLLWVLRAVIGALGLATALLFAFATRLHGHIPEVVLQPHFYAKLTPSADMASRVQAVAVSMIPWSVGVATVVATVMVLWPARRLGHGVRAAPIVVLVGFAVPVAGTERLAGYLPMVWAIGMAAPLGWLETFVGRHARRSRRPRRLPRRTVQLAAIAVPLLCLPLLTGPLIAFRDFQLHDTSEHDLASSFSAYELQDIPAYAARYGRTKMLLSDPITQQIADGLALMNTAGGTHMPVPVTLDLVDAVSASTGQQARAALLRLQGRYGPFTLVYSGRTAHWGIPNARQLKRHTLTLDQLRYAAAFRPWDFSDLPDRFVRSPKAKLLTPIANSGCVTGTLDEGEIVFFDIDCGTS